MLGQQYLEFSNAYVCWVLTNVGLSRFGERVTVRHDSLCGGGGVVVFARHIHLRVKYSVPNRLEAGCKHKQVIVKADRKIQTQSKLVNFQNRSIECKEE